MNGKLTESFFIKNWLWLHLQSFANGKDLQASLQLRELQASVEHEREKNASLQREVVRLKDELHQKQTEGNAVIGVNFRVRASPGSPGKSWILKT